MGRGPHGQLISRIYEVDPLLCSCGDKLKITTFVTHPEHIRRILRGIGRPITIPEFDPPYELEAYDICHLVPDTHDGFPELIEQMHYQEYGGADFQHHETGLDPPFIAEVDPPHWQD